MLDYKVISQQARWSHRLEDVLKIASFYKLLTISVNRSAINRYEDNKYGIICTILRHKMRLIVPLLLLSGTFFNFGAGFGHYSGIVTTILMLL